MYRPGNLDASSLEALANSMRLELDKLAIQFSQPTEYKALDANYSPPERIIDGMIVRADGTSWNPGSGAGVYAYYGGAWHFLG